MAEKPTYEELERRVQGLKKDYTQLEKNLLESRSITEEIMTYMTEGLVLTDTRGRIIFINQRLSEMLEYLPEEVIGERWLDMVPAEQQAIAKQAEARRAQGYTDRYEIMLHRKDGHKFPVLIGAGPRFDKQSNEFIGTMGVVTDITERKLVEDALRESEEKHRRLFETMAQGVVYQATDMTILLANPAAEKILGLSLAQMRGKSSINQSWKMIQEDGTKVPGKDHPAMIALRTGQTVGPVVRGVFHPERNAYVWLSITVVPLFQPGETKPFQVYATFEDVTERKRSEEFLQESESRFRSIYENTAVGLAQVSLDFKIISANEAYCNMLGYQEKDLVGRHLKEITHADVIEENIQKQSNLASGKIDHYRMEKKFIHKNGETVHAILDANLIRDPSGKAIYFLGSVVDITERKQAEMDLQSQKELLKGILDSIKDIIGVQLPDHTMVQYNRAGYELLGLTKDQIQGKKCYTLLGRNHPCENCAASRAYISKELETIEKYIPELGRHFLCSSNPILDNNKNIKLVIQQLTDITEKKKIDEQLNQAQKMESVGRLAGGVAHDFNNMLGVILGHTELALLQTDENHDLYSDLKEIQKAAKRSADTTKQLLAFARKDIISPKQIDLNDTVESMLNMLRRLIGEDIDLVWKPAAHLWPVKMDPSQIDQILANLCVNARDAIDGVGKLTIETGIKTFDEEYCKEHAGFIPGDFVLLAVSDNGCGMEKDILDNLFEPFFTTKDVGKGTGLGLATIYGIVRQNKGFIDVYSEPGQGSTFNIYLPRLVADEYFDKKVPEKKAVARGTETILLVEDEPSILRMTRMMLERKGYSVLTAATPLEAMEKAKNHSGAIDLLMSDVVMPEMNGRDLAGQITALYPDIRLLFMSGYTADVIAHHGVMDHGVAFIQKPFSMADMATKVREALDKA
jgi:PAS domain S-box-containing protein